MIMFFFGMAALALKAVDVAGQHAALGRSPLGPKKGTVPLRVDRGTVPFFGQSPVEACDSLLGRLDRLPRRRQREYYVSRLRAALEHVSARRSADALGDELKYLADADASRVHASYSLFRMIVWAIPILGFLGTVIGITMALNGVDLQAAEQSMSKVLTGLGLKFDTTALALTLSMLLMFAHFLVDRAEGSLLDRVDRQVTRELAWLLPKSSAGADGQTAAVRRMAEEVIRAAEQLVERQSQLWQASIEAAHERWARLADIEVLSRAVEATGQIARLEETLNRNLAALAGAKNFEETVMSLAAAIHLLTARLAEAPAGPVKIKLESSRRAAHAA
jgi:hypothetical protein